MKNYENFINIRFVYHQRLYVSTGEKTVIPACKIPFLS